MCIFKKKIPPVIITPSLVSLWSKDFTKDQFSWNDFSPLSGKGMRGLYPDYQERCIFLKDNVLQTKEGLELSVSTGSAIKSDWQSNGYYTFDWLKGKYNFCGQIVSWNPITQTGRLLYPGQKISWVVKMPPLGYTYFPALWLFRALFGPQQPEVDFELFGSESNPYQIGGPSNYMKFSYHYRDTHYSKGYTFPYDLSTAFHTYSFVWNVKYIAWEVDGIEMFRVTDHLPIDPMLWIANMQSGSETSYYPAYTHVFTKAEEGAKMIIKSVNIYQL